MGDECSVSGCARPSSVRGWCEAHYRRWRRHGDPEGGRVAPGAPLAERVWPLVDRSAGPDACWEWQGRRDENGYGRLSVDGQEQRVHRLAFVLANGPLPPIGGYHGAVVRHRCDNPPCCNPAHLDVGTAAENVRDAVERGRHRVPPWDGPRDMARGERVAGARLTRADVVTARALAASGESISALARRFGVSRRAVQLAVQRRTWGHVA